MKCLALLLLALPLAAQEIRPSPTACPPSDGYVWQSFKDRPSGKVLWVQTRTQEEFERLCGHASACAIRFEEVTVIVAQSPAWAFGEAFRRHEECHDAWKHGAPPVVSLYR